MAHHKSAKKRIRQNIKRKLRNHSHLSEYRTAIKKFQALIKDQKKEDALTAIKNVQKIIDKTASKGLIHKNTAARNKSQLALAVNKLETVSA